MNKVHVKTGDSVVLLSGKYADKYEKDGKRRVAKVLQVSPKEGKVIVEGLHMVTKHVKPRKMGDPGGIVKAEGAIHASKVMLVCPRCGEPTRIAHKILESGEKERMCKKCRATF